MRQSAALFEVYNTLLCIAKLQIECCKSVSELVASLRTGEIHHGPIVVRALLKPSSKRDTGNEGRSGGTMVPSLIGVWLRVGVCWSSGGGFRSWIHRWYLRRGICADEEVISKIRWHDEWKERAWGWVTFSNLAMIWRGMMSRDWLWGRGWRRTECWLATVLRRSW